MFCLLYHGSFEAFYKVRRTIPLDMAFRIATLKRSWKKEGLMLIRFCRKNW